MPSAASLSKKQWNIGSKSNIVPGDIMNSQVCLTMLPIPNSGDLPLRDRSFVVALVVLAHALLLLSYTSSSGQSKSAHRELSISVTLPSPPQTAPVKPRPVVKPIPVEPQPVQQVAAPDMPAETMAPSPPVESSPAQPEKVAQIGRASCR